MRRAELGRPGLPISQKEASLRMGLKDNQVNRWEGGVIPGAESAEPLQEFLGITQDELGALVMESTVRRWRETGR